MAEICARCGKKVYIVDKLALLNQTWHKACFKCTVCGTTLNMKNYVALGGKPYCKPHYPMPKSTEVGEVAPPVNPNAYNRGNEDQTTQEKAGMGQETYEFNNYQQQAPPPQQYDQQYDQQQYDDQQYYQQ